MFQEIDSAVGGDGYVMRTMTTVEARFANVEGPYRMYVYGSRVCVFARDA